MLRSAFWLVCAVLSGLMFLLFFITKFDVVLSTANPILTVLTLLLGVGCVACWKAARAEPRTKLDRLVAQIEVGPESE